MSKGAVLVTGGAGYIGSHVVKLLGQRKEEVVVLDNLSTGFEESVVYGTFVQGDTGDTERVSQVLKEHDIKSIMHFAAHTIVPESVSNPLKYYANNTCSSRNLLACAQQAGIEHFIFSSTAAVYGIPDSPLADEDAPLAPINPYGMSKLMTETMLRDLSHASSLRHAVLRYFNVAGSDPEGEIGQSTAKATLLIKVACEVATGKRDQLKVFGTDYPTKDGTGVRDYIHVNDLAHAHLKALDYLRDGGESTTVNCGYGHGYSVREVIETLEQVDGKKLAVDEEPRRAGDPPELVAKADKVRELFGWEPQHDDLAFIIKTSLDWEKKLADRQ